MTERFNKKSNVTSKRPSAAATQKPPKPPPQSFQSQNTIHLIPDHDTNNTKYPPLQRRENNNLNNTNWTRCSWNFHPRPKLKGCTFTSTGGHVAPYPPMTAMDGYKASLLLSIACWPHTNITSSNSSQYLGAPPLFNINAPSNEKAKVVQSYFRLKLSGKENSHVG